MGALAGKTVLLVTHQVDFLPAFHSILLMSLGKVLNATPYDELLASCQEFQDLVNANNDTAGSERSNENVSSGKHKSSTKEIEKVTAEVQQQESAGDQLIQKEERETGDIGFKPYIQYLKQGRGFFNFSLSIFLYSMFIVGQLLQFYWLALNLADDTVSRVKLFTVYSVIMAVMILSLLIRSFFIVDLGVGAGKSIFSTLLNSLFRAPMLFYDSTPVGRILSRVSSDMNIIELEVAFKLIIAVGGTLNTYNIFLVLLLAVDDSVIDRKLIERLLKTSSYQDYGSKTLEFLGLNGEEDQNDIADAPYVSPNNYHQVLDASSGGSHVGIDQGESSGEQFYSKWTKC